MTDKRAKIPGPDHPITIERNPARIVVMVARRVIADTRDAVTLREASYPPVRYVPRKDVDMTALVRSGHTTYCPYKGNCGYDSISIGGAPIDQRRLDLRGALSSRRRLWRMASS